jgi:hypothetical protein
MRSLQFSLDSHFSIAIPKRWGIVGSVIDKNQNERTNMKITMHYNGDGKSEIEFRNVKLQENGMILLSPSQWDRIQKSQRGSGLDGTVGSVTWTVVNTSRYETQKPRRRRARQIGRCGQKRSESGSQ